MKIDNTALENFQKCPAMHDIRIRQGYVPRSRSPALRHGGAIHAGLATWYRGHGLDASLDSIAQAWDNSWDTDDYRTLQRCAEMMIKYASRYPSEQFTIVGAPEVPIVEQTFTLETGMYLPCRLSFLPTKAAPTDPSVLPDIDPFRRTCNMDQGFPVIEGQCACGREREAIEYGGILDLKVDFTGTLYIVDHKSTSIVKPLKEGYFFDQFKPDNQMTGYIWAGGKLSGGRCAGAIINGLGMNKSEICFNRGITTRNDKDFAEWLVSLHAHCVELKHCEATGVYPLRTVNCITKYGKCAYHPIHALSNPEDRQRLLEQDYIYQPWDYENRDQVEVASDA